jgi:hypothetical protein
MQAWKLSSIARPAPTFGMCAYLSLLTGIRDPAVPLQMLRARRDELQAALHEIYKSAPRTNDEAYGEAQTPSNRIAMVLQTRQGLWRALPGGADVEVIAAHQVSR